MRAALTGLLAVCVLGFAASAASAQLPIPTSPDRQPPKKDEPKKEPKKDEPSIHGTWVGYWTVAGTKVKFTTTLRKDGTYKTVTETGDFVNAEKGTYKYDDGVLESEPEGGIVGTFTVTFEDKDTIKVKGGGISLTMKRQ